MGVVIISQELASSTGRPRTVDLMSVVQAILGSFGDGLPLAVAAQ